MMPETLLDKLNLQSNAPRHRHVIDLSRPRWWQWLTVLSLDAPIVAVLWEWMLSRCAGVSLARHHYLAVGCVIWLAYVMDRWFEAGRLSLHQIQTHRHYFYKRHRGPVALLWMVVSSGTISMALATMNAHEIVAGTVVLAAAIVYLVSHQLLHRHYRWRLPKEICVGLLIAAGSTVFTIANQPHAGIRIGMPTMALAGLCICNCLLISAWEVSVDRIQGQMSAVLQIAQIRTLCGYLPWLLAVLATVMTCVGTPEDRLAFVCATASALLMGLVDQLQPRYGRQFARAFVDFALMTPVFPLIVEMTCNGRHIQLLWSHGHIGLTLNHVQLFLER